MLKPSHSEQGDEGGGSNVEGVLNYFRYVQYVIRPEIMNYRVIGVLHISKLPPLHNY